MDNDGGKEWKNNTSVNNLYRWWRGDEEKSRRFTCRLVRDRGDRMCANCLLKT